MQTVLAVVGPTAAGKTELSIALAEQLGGEIVSADSRQIYRGMDIGSAKATPAQRARVVHHLLDVAAPDQPLSLAEYQRLALHAIAGIQARRRLAMLVGGTGQYVRAVLEGWSIPAVAPDMALRERLEAQAAAEGPVALHAWLAALDPVAAGRIDYRNIRRVIRALEVCIVSGRPISEQQTRVPPPFRSVQLGVTRPRAELYARIDARVDAMVEQGLVEEVQRLVASGYGYNLPAMTGLGYRQIGLYLRGEATLGEAVALVKQQTRRLVQQQYTWFGLDDAAIRWVDPGQVPFREIVAQVQSLVEDAA